MTNPSKKSEEKKSLKDCKKDFAQKKVTTSPEAADKDNIMKKYIDDITKYIKANGKCRIAVIGSKVTKPAKVTEKLGKVIGDNKDIFKVASGFVDLVNK